MVRCMRDGCRGVAKAEEEEMFIPPLVAPTLPARFYFRYGQAIETNRSDSREHLDGVYRQVLPHWGSSSCIMVLMLGGALRPKGWRCRSSAPWQAGSCFSQ